LRGVEKKFFDRSQVVFPLTGLCRRELPATMPGMSDATIKLYGYAPLGELTDMSVFVAKVEAYLRLAGVAYEKRPGNPRSAPRGKLPFITHAGRSIPDSQRILEYLREQGIADLDAGLTPEQHTELFMLRSMLESDLYFVLVYFRWQDDVGWARYQPVLAEALRRAKVPGLLIPIVARSARKSAVAQLAAQGTGRRDRAENLAHAREIVAALAHLLDRRDRDEGPWWFGAKPSSADAIVHAFVGGCIATGLDNGLDELADDHPRLREWFEHAHTHVKRTT
jgi:glutathione S-transferase